MKNITQSWQSSGILGFLVGLATLSAAAGIVAFGAQSAAANYSHDDYNPNPGIAPINSRPMGKTYGEWAATRWQWALQQPRRSNPTIDKGSCSTAQSGNVWFLSDDPTGSPTGPLKAVNRDCTVPPNTSLFFPLITAVYFAFLNDPPEQRTPAFLRSLVACDPPQQMMAWIDGVPVKHPEQYLSNSPLFNAQLLKDNQFSVQSTDPKKPGYAEDLYFSPSVDRGYYLFVYPLKPGKHTLRWRAAMTCPNFGGAPTFRQDVTYHITVRSNNYGN